MDQGSIERLRNPQFSSERRGYSPREVDNFLFQIADWLESEAAEEIGSFAAKRKLELVSKSTANILLTTEQEAEEIRQEAKAAAAKAIAEAEAASQQIRKAAADHDHQVRETADRESAEKVAAASARARAIVEQGEQRRAAIEAVIAELSETRDRALADLQRLVGEVTATVAAHQPGGPGDLLGALAPGGQRPREGRRGAMRAPAEDPSVTAS